MAQQTKAKTKATDSTFELLRTLLIVNLLQAGVAQNNIARVAKCHSSEVGRISNLITPPKVKVSSKPKKKVAK